MTPQQILSLRAAGCLLCAIARRTLNLAILRYVDDFYGAEPEPVAVHAMTCFARCVCRLPGLLFMRSPFDCRLVRACLGDTAVSAEKLGSGNPLVILGVEIRLGLTGKAPHALQHRASAPLFLLAGATFKPSRDKIEKWLLRINTALDTGRLTSGEASKLSGALSWATQQAFRRLGRAMIRPIIRCVLQAFATGGAPRKRNKTFACSPMQAESRPFFSGG